MLKTIERCFVVYNYLKFTDESTAGTKRMEKVAGRHR